MEEIIDKMEMIDGDYSVQSNGLIVKAVNIDNGKIKIGGFKRDINDIPINKQADISEYVTGSRYEQISERDVILENSEIIWFDDIVFTEYTFADAKLLYDINNEDSFDLIAEKIEEYIGHSIFYISMNKEDVINSVIEEWEIARVLELNFIFIKDKGIYIAL